jgi:hypothetical protein
MDMLKIVDTKDPSETVPFSFDFGPDSAGKTEIPAGDTIISAVVTVSVRDGIDPNPANILLLEPDLSQAPIVIQWVTGGIDGVNYLLRCVARTSPSRCVLVRPGVLPVKQER